MRALISQHPGGPETLTVADLPEPEPGPGEVRVAVRACGINYPDVLIIEDRYQFRPERPFAPGAEISGLVDATGPGVTGLRPGDRVFGLTGWGGLADKILLSAERLFAVPDAMSFEEAAALLMTYGTSFYALHDKGALRPGETLLVLGAAGGVGLAAVELGKAMGVRVIAAVSTAAKAEVARARGADETIIYPAGALARPDAAAFLADIRSYAPDGVDVVYDAVGGDYAEPALRAIAWDGRYLIIGFPAGIPQMPLNLPLLKGCSIIGVFWGAFVERNLAAHRANVLQLLDLYGRGLMKPLVSEIFPLARGGEAIARLASRSAVGKIVVTL